MWDDHQLTSPFWSVEPSPEQSFEVFIRNLSFSFSCIWHNSATRTRAASFSRVLDQAQRHTTVVRTPLDEGSVRRRDLYLTRNRRPCRIRTSRSQKRSAAVLCLRPLVHSDQLHKWKLTAFKNRTEIYFFIVYVSTERSDQIRSEIKWLTFRKLFVQCYQCDVPCHMFSVLPANGLRQFYIPPELRTVANLLAKSLVLFSEKKS